MTAAYRKGTNHRIEKILIICAVFQTLLLIKFISILLVMYPETDPLKKNVRLKYHHPYLNEGELDELLYRQCGLGIVQIIFGLLLLTLGYFFVKRKEDRHLIVAGCLVS